MFPVPFSITGNRCTFDSHSVSTALYKLKGNQHVKLNHKHTYTQKSSCGIQKGVIFVRLQYPSPSPMQTKSPNRWPLSRIDGDQGLQSPVFLERLPPHGDFVLLQLLDAITAVVFVVSGNQTVLTPLELPPEYFFESPEVIFTFDGKWSSSFSVHWLFCNHSIKIASNNGELHLKLRWEAKLFKGVERFYVIQIKMRIITHGIRLQTLHEDRILIRKSGKREWKK